MLARGADALDCDEVLRARHDAEGRQRGGDDERRAIVGIGMERRANRRHGAARKSRVAFDVVGIECRDARDRRHAAPPQLGDECGIEIEDVDRIA